MDNIENAIKIFNAHQGIMRMSGAIKFGISRKTLYKMVEQEIIIKLERGLYSLSNGPQLGNPDIITVSIKVPKGIICLVSALVVHNLTTQIPHGIDVGIHYKSRISKMISPPLRIFRFSGDAFTEGIETIKMDGKEINVFNREKTICDCFKFKDRIGIDIAKEALKSYIETGKYSVEKLLKYADICKVKTIVKSYLEALL